MSEIEVKPTMSSRHRSWAFAISASFFAVLIVWMTGWGNPTNALHSFTLTGSMTVLGALMATYLGIEPVTNIFKK